MDMNYTVQTTKSFNVAIEELKVSLSKHKFGVLFELNLSDKFKEKGLEFDKKFTILEVCNPVLAKEILDKYIEAGYFLPCKIVVYEEKGSVFMGMPKPTELIGLIKNDELTRIAKEVEKELTDAIDEAKGTT